MPPRRLLLRTTTCADVIGPGVVIPTSVELPSIAETALRISRLTLFNEVPEDIVREQFEFVLVRLDPTLNNRSHERAT